MPEKIRRKRKSDHATEPSTQRSQEQQLARKSVRDHLAIVSIAVLVSLVIYVCRQCILVEDVTPAQALFEVRDLKGKGMGMVARRDIKRGEVILKEKPLFVVPTEVSHMFPGALIMNSLALLKPIQREAFWNLSYVNLPGHLVEGTPEHSEGLALAIFQTNAVAAGGAVGIFPQMARLNHGCSSAFNSVYSWRQNEGVIVVHALKSVRQGQELLTTYADTKRPRDERRSFLQAHYGFTCQCSVCSLDAGRSQLSDARLVKMAQLYSRFKSWGDGTLSGREAIDIAGEIWRVGEEEGYHSERGQLAADATYIAASHSDASAVRVWARLAREWYTYELGADSEQAEGMAVLFEHPERHSGWATRRAEIVGGLT